MGRFGKPECNNIRTVEETFRAAVANGYLQQLQAYGVGSGYTAEEAELRMREGLGMPLHMQDGELYDYFKDQALTALEDKAVSTGDNIVKGDTPASTTGDVLNNTDNANIDGGAK